MKFMVGALAVLACSTLTAGDARPRSLTFEDRVNAQEAIERVYHAHRTGVTESFETAVPRAVLEAKVRAYLERSEAVTDEMLRSELTRMESATRMPDRLHELYAALGNDPYVIGECLARAAIVGRIRLEAQASDRAPYVGALKRPGARTLTELRGRSVERAGAAVGVVTPKDPQLGLALAPNGICPQDDGWASTASLDAPSHREFHSAVWTGSEMIVWGGYVVEDQEYVLNSGGRYDPATDSWSPTTMTGAPVHRALHTAVWTGSRMVIWGGVGSAGYLTSGGRYNPVTDTWTATSLTGAPAARIDHTAVWTGSRMIVWGGFYFDTAEHFLNTGARYDPSTDAWTATSTGANVPSARELHTAVWTGSRMIVWGGWIGTDVTNTGGRYDPATNTWTTTTTTNAPAAVELQVAVWTGSRMVVWGGWDGFGDVDTGGQYDPALDSWTLTTLTDAPLARDSHAAVWTGSRMVVWGGGIFDGQDFIALDTGARYDPGTDSWTPTTTTDVPTARFYHTAVWTDFEMVVWGGEDGFDFFDTGGNYTLGTSLDNDGDGVSGCEGDCDDSNSAIYPGALEVCNGDDDDCDTIVDNGGDALCDDLELCTTDACDGALGCSNVEDTCADTNACTVESCVSGIGCVYPVANMDTTGFSANRVDGRDLVVLAEAWNSCPLDARYDAAADLDPSDPCIEDDDFHQFMTSFGRTCP